MTLPAPLPRPASPNTAEQLAPRLWVVRFPVAEAIVGDQCEHLVPPLAEAARAGPLVLVATLPETVNSIDPSMVSFWLKAMTSRGVHVQGISVVTASLAVRAVVNGFALAMQMREKPILATTFPDEADALIWGRSVLAAG